MQGVSGSLRMGVSVERIGQMLHRLKSFIAVTLTFFNKAPDKWITDMIWRATTDGAVIDNLALGIDTASSRARVDTFLIRTSFVKSAI